MLGCRFGKKNSLKGIDFDQTSLIDLIKILDSFHNFRI